MEIEIKAQLKDKKGTVENLASLGCVLSPVKTQDDMVWAAQGGSMEVFLANPVFLRIRIQNNEKIILEKIAPKLASEATKSRVCLLHGRPSYT